MDTFDGKPLNSPNDIVVKSDDSIWFSEAQPAVHGGEPLGLFALCEHAGREGRVIRPCTH